MNSDLREFLDTNNIQVNKITIRNKARIIDNKYVIKDNIRELSKIYKYLTSRSFDYFPKLLLETDNYNIFEYIDSIDIDDNEKAKDIMKLVGLLHAKTSYYKEIDIDDYKKIYEDTINRLNYLNNYYLDIMGIIDREVFMSPSHYFLARNISIIFNCLDRSHYLIEGWYKIIDKKKKVRMVTIHNNLDIDNYIRNDKGYLLSWDRSKTDMPIYDLYNFYKKSVLDFSLEDLMSYYENVYPLLEEEKLLLISLLLMPDKLVFDKREYAMCEIIKEEIQYLDKILRYSINYFKLPKDSEINKGKKSTKLN